MFGIQVKPKASKPRLYLLLKVGSAVKALMVRRI
jgi:hypothetical protein